MTYFNNRKGFFGDAAFIIGILFLIGLVTVIGFKVMDSFNDEWSASDEVSDDSKQYVQDTTDRYVALWDGIFMTVFALLAVGIILSVASLGSQPQFFFLIIVFGFFVVAGAAMLSNAFSQATSGSFLGSSLSEFTFVPLVLDNLVGIAVFLLVLLLLGLFVKVRTR